VNTLHKNDHDDWQLPTERWRPNRFALMYGFSRNILGMKRGKKKVNRYRAWRVGLPSGDHPQMIRQGA